MVCLMQVRGVASQGGSGGEGGGLASMAQKAQALGCTHPRSEARVKVRLVGSTLCVCTYACLMCACVMCMRCMVCMMCLRHVRAGA